MVYSDNAGNHFLGDAVFSAGTSKLTGLPLVNLSAELEALCASAQLRFRNVAPQNLLEPSIIDNTKTLLFFATKNDIIDDRYTFALGTLSQYSNYSPVNQVIMWNNSGCTTTNNTSIRGGTAWACMNANGLVATLVNGGGYSQLVSGNQSFINQFQWIGVADENSLALIYFVYGNNNLLYLRFMYAGRLENVNPNYGYYNSSIETDSILLTNNCPSMGGVNDPIPTYQVGGVHRIVGSHKQILTTGEAQYPIVCSDGQSPTAQWATDMYVFDNNATLGYPAIGRVRNLLLAQGSYTIGKPVRIQGTVQPDNGFNAWLPVGTFAGKTVLMRCYSSVEL